jgi:preprotein translocase subunit SecA
VFKLQPSRRKSSSGIARPRTMVAPGLIWGNYPERPEPRVHQHGLVSWFERCERRSSGLARIETLARSTVQLSLHFTERLKQRPEVGSELLATLRNRLRRDGLTAGNCSTALAWVAARIKLLLNIELHENQLICALHLLDQTLSEMATGEGKTLAAACAASVMALAGAPVHVLTANDYLAERDAEQLRTLYDDLELTMSSALESHSIERRRAGYRADVVYASAKTIAFDYLRDRLTRGQRGMARLVDEHTLLTEPTNDCTLMLRGLSCAIIDEADAILLDEAKTPLIIADAHTDPQERGRLWQALDLARHLAIDTGFKLDKSERRVTLTAAGIASLDAAASAYGGVWQNRLHRHELVRQALSALHLLTRDADYLVQDGRVVIVDPITGRIAEGRQWSMGLHALVALKEQLPMPLGSRTLASLTYPRLFRRYHHLSGLSGTLLEDRAELLRTYGLRVKTVARHRPLQRRQAPLRCFPDQEQQHAAAHEQALKISAGGQPVLIATDSVADSDLLARRFQLSGRPVTVLNAAQTRDEAIIIAQAGLAAQITIATQVAGRGTDIVLAAGVAQAGGLHVLNLQINRSARIDRQIAGRCARQGDAGSAEHWIRFEQSPLQATEIPGLLRPLRYLLAPFGRATGPMNRLAAFLLLNGWQAYCRLDDANQRKSTLQHDQDWARRLHFATLIE